MIGPHEERELELMKAGLKPAAMFVESDGIQIFPEDEFDALVERGQLVKHQRLEGDVRRVIYAIPREAWRMEALLVACNHSRWDANLERIIGSLLGYRKEDVEEFIAHLTRVGLAKAP